MSALYRTDTLRRIEAAGLERMPAGTLMDRAAAAVADAAARLARARPRATPIVAMVGPGNNGGDALLALAKLRDRGFPVHALAASTGAPAAADALAVWRRWTDAGGTLGTLETLPDWLARSPLVIDGLFGIGLQRPLAGAVAQAVVALNAASTGVVAVDVPSGIDADRGNVVGGPDGLAVRATCTVTMIGDKPGLHTGVALDHVGIVEVAPLGCEPADAPDGQLFDEACARGRFRSRPRDSHKGRFGGVLVVGGAAGTTGAALLAGRAALAGGAGRVSIASPDGRVFDPGQPQLMTRALDAPHADLDALCVGCGLGFTDAARLALLAALRSPLPLALDADALTLLAREPALGRRLRARRAPAVLTPHPLEAARLLDVPAADVQADRIGAALRLAGQTGAVVVLKGAGSIVAQPSGAWSVNASGGPALASAGTGDVLAGLVTSLLAQGYPAPEAARLATWLHGAAADRWQHAHPLGAGLSAAELADLLPAAMHAA